ncbi:S53 family peptidase [Curtobacterium sp. MCSS17_016]|uniref:S53 family peptidase n=1 Tax=Curtobacterium sp. MCSS17_016 TaxID=2175644 RepID=UPI000DAA1AB7|nr:S53 family peptidase [Curtobacterium sp. MCSS17_016]WIE81199.1 S53 family peptidase [Curtobacterium sp. MCSS17_016]
MRFRPHRPGRRRTSAALITIIAITSGSALTSTPASATPLTPAPVHGAAGRQSNTADTARTPGATPVSITVILTPDDRGELRSIATTSAPTDVSAVAPPLGHAPHVRTALEDAGFTVDADSDRWDLTATGTAADAERLFTVHLVGVGEKMHPTSEPVMPSSFDGKATTVLGLDQRPVISPTAVPGTPASTLTGAYGAPSSATAGAGTTIATVQFSGWNANDLKTYAKAAGKAMPSYTQISVDGASTTKKDSDAGAFEVALDQQTILAVAPKAAQRVYFADNSVQGMYDAYSHVAADVAQHGITTVSVSWLMCEPQLSARTITVLEDAIDRVVAAGATMFAASGDHGAYCTTGQKGVGYPASSPAVLSVGGTSLTKSGTAYRETTWGNSTGSTGGGLSSKFTRPSYQSKTGIASSRRQTPDIAAIADPNTGPAVYSSIYGRWMLAGGTSLASPILAAELASTLGNRGCSIGIGDIHSTLYANPRGFRDITTGGNGTDKARRGYDLVTGLGSPNWSALKNALPKASRCQQRSPIGTIDAVTTGPGTVTVRGWTYDNSDSRKPLTVTVTVGGEEAGAVTANGARSDVNRAKKVSGNHGFSKTMKTAKQGRQDVCITATNIGAGANSLLGCRTVTLPSPNPTGTLDSASGSPGAVTVRGWAFDPSGTSTSLTGYVTVGGTNIGNISINGARSDVNKAKKVTGKHGYNVTLRTTKTGKQPVCVVAKNIGAGADTRLNCRTISIADSTIRGSYEEASASTAGVTVRGWTYDTTTPSRSINVAVTSDGKIIGTITADSLRADVNRVKNVTGKHGFNTAVPAALTVGKHSICVVSRNIGTGGDASLGCRTVTVAASAPTPTPTPDKPATAGTR